MRVKVKVLKKKKTLFQSETSLIGRQAGANLRQDDVCIFILPSIWGSIWPCFPKVTEATATQRSGSYLRESTQQKQTTINLHIML